MEVRVLLRRGLSSISTKPGGCASMLYQGQVGGGETPTAIAPFIGQNGIELHTEDTIWQTEGEGREGLLETVWLAE